MDTTQNLYPILSGYIAWIKAHEKLLIIVLGAWLAFHFYGNALNAWVDHDKRLATIAQQKVEADASANKQLEQQLADLKVQLATVSAQAQASIRQRQIDTDAQKQKNNQSTSPEVAARIVQLLRVQPQDVTASAVDGTVVFTPSAAHTDVNALEDGTKAQADNLDLNKQLSACNAVVGQDQIVIAGKNKELVDTRDKAEKDLNAEKANSKKQFRRGFKWGYGAGAATIIAIKIASVLKVL